jgi:uncharacterized protein YjiS (DUF1127 family)
LIIAEVLSAGKGYSAVIEPGAATMTDQTNTTMIAPAHSALPRRPKGFWAALLGAIDRVRQRRALAELDARLLRDIGRTEEEARREAGRWL